MSTNPVSAKLSTVVGPLAATSGLLAATLGFVTFNSDALLSRGFERAFAALERPASQVPSRTLDGIAGTEEFWLRAQANANIVKAVAVGQHLTLTVHGTQRHLTITHISETNAGFTHIEPTDARAGGLVVTCREGDEITGREVRFRVGPDMFVELPTPASTTPSAELKPTPRAL